MAKHLLLLHILKRKLNKKRLQFTINQRNLALFLDLNADTFLLALLKH